MGDEEGLCDPRIVCPPRPEGNWGEVHEQDDTGRPLWAAQFDHIQCRDDLLIISVDYEGCDGSIQVYATVMIMYNDVASFHIITCNPRGMRDEGNYW